MQLKGRPASRFQPFAQWSQRLDIKNTPIVSLDRQTIAPQIIIRRLGSPPDWVKHHRRGCSSERLTTTTSSSGPGNHSVRLQPLLLLPREEVLRLTPVIQPRS